jgi:hypothetical protein
MNLKKKSLSVFLIVLALALLAVVTVSAAVTWGAVTGPTYNPASGYEFTVDATLSIPHRYVCILYTIPPAAEVTGECTNQSGNTWSCTIPGNYTETSIDYRFAGYANLGCTGNQVTTGAPSGSFSTGPNAVELTSFTSSNQSNDYSILSAIVVVLLAGILLAAGFFWNRRSPVEH